MTTMTAKTETSGCSDKQRTRTLPEAQDTSMTTTDLATPQRALAIGAHPDDIEFGCGATLSKWAEAGCEVSLLVCTDGSKGTWDAHADTAALVVRRQREQMEAARRLGTVGEVRFLGETDGELGCGIGLQSRVAEAIRELRPQVLAGARPVETLAAPSRPPSCRFSVYRRSDRRPRPPFLPRTRAGAPQTR